jgi:lipid-A-disaccharide synthase
MPQVDLFLLAGESSGDLQGAKLIEELLRLDPTLKIAAVAGPRMRQFPIECIEPMENLQVMGFIDVIRALPKMVRLFYSLRRKILALNPKAFIGIDYPGLNLRLHRSLRKKGFQGEQIHYICPTVWAWGKKRIPLMAQNLDLLLTLLPFEPACFAHTSLPAHYVGHPLTASIAQFTPDPTFRSRYGLAPNDPICALFPGSRSQEIERNFPLQLATARRLNLPIAVSTANEARSAQLRQLAPDLLLISSEDTYNLMHHASLALAKSGTVTLELALHKTPTVVTYAIKPLDLFLATRLFKINLPYYALPNLILQTQIFPELFGPNLTPAALYDHAARLAFDPEARAICRSRCEALIAHLGPSNASRAAAAHILALLTPKINSTTEIDHHGGGEAPHPIF